MFVVTDVSYRLRYNKTKSGLVSRKAVPTRSGGQLSVRIDLIDDQAEVRVTDGDNVTVGSEIITSDSDNLMILAKKIARILLIRNGGIFGFESGL